MLTIEVLDNSGYPDVYVTGQYPRNQKEFGWVAPGFPLGDNYFRRQSRWPIKLTNNDTTPFETVDPVELVAAEGTIPGIKDILTLTLIDAFSGDTIRELTVSVPFPTLVVGGKAKLLPGQSAYNFNRFCLFDLSGIPNNPTPAPRLYALFISCNLPGGYASYSTPVRIGGMQVRHGVQLDIP